MEKWKEIKDFENYWVSSEGKVWSEKSNKFLKPREDRYGYLRVHLWRNGKQYWRSIHRLVAQAFIENRENKPEVDHINRDTKDNRAENLRWATSTENNNNKDFNSYREKRGTTIIEKINDEISIGYSSLSSVPGIDKRALSNHTRKGKVEFTCKGRTFICPSNML